MARTVLIDADIAAFQVATTAEEVFNFDGRHVLHADLNEGIDELNKLIEWIIETTDSDQAALFLTGSENFRKTVLPTYKGNRKDVRKPMILQGLKDHILTLPRSFLEEGLEGDDLIGIHATKPHKGERVIYSADKDLQTIPGLHWDAEDGEVTEIDPVSAELFFLEQVLTGDAVDNYKGCPGVGPVKAKKIIEKALEDDGNVWQAIVDAYEKAGLSEKDAIQQARCARILRHGEYDFEKGKVNLWTPQ